MGRIRIVGRSKQGRCVFCHDDLAGEEVCTCPGCHATWHQDCRAEALRCPTRGCDGPPPRRERDGRRGRRGRRGRMARRGDSSPDFQRLGPTRRGDAVQALTSSAILSALVCLVSGAYLSWPVFGWSGFAALAFSGRKKDPGVLLILLALASAAAFLGTLHWLLRLPGVFREVNHLLDSTEPTLMQLTVHKHVTTDSKGRTSTRWDATLVGGTPPTLLSLSLSGFLPPAWLRSTGLSGTPVLVYGLPPPGPYLIELEDGRLAVVHPD